MKFQNPLNSFSEPFYVLTNKGKDVVEASGLWDALVKKFGLDPLIDILKVLLEMLQEQVTNYATFSFFKDLVDQLVLGLGLLKQKAGQFKSFA